MTYESTGEVRVPRRRDLYLAGDGFRPAVITACGNTSEYYTPKVIMRPVEEPKQPIAYHIVIPFSIKYRAEDELKTLFDKTNLMGHIEEVYE